MDRERRCGGSARPDHEWQTRLVNRTKQNKGCPFCAGQRPSVTNSLAALYPEIALELHPTKNDRITANYLTAGSNKRVWWKCAKGSDHEWRTTVNSRTINGTGCPCCAGRQLSVTNSLAALYPEIALQLHPTRNSGLKADRVVAGSTKRVWWQCSKVPEHEWRTTIESRTSQHPGRRRTGCPSCSDYGFDEIAPATLYYVKIEIEGAPLYKIGITNRDMGQRFHKDRQKVTVIFAREYESGREAKDAETAILDEFCYALYAGATPFSDGTGTSEVFEFDVLGLDIQD